MSNLVIVESPAKAGTIKGYLGKGFKVIASKGHVRDLPKSSLGVDIENNFEPKYINIRGKGDLIKELKKEAKSASMIYLATDPDREGEAISWHLSNVLGLPAEKTKRVAFNEITKTAVKEAIQHPGDIDMKLVDSQQARRILDRIVGYKLSPILWKKIKSGLSAGRVQSVATRIIVDRENEIRAFISDEYWKIEAHLKTVGSKPLKANFYGDKNGKIALTNEEQTKKIVDACEKSAFSVSNIKKSVRFKNPAPPFITSTLQQEANRRLGFQSVKTMKTAQELYEGINLGTSGTQGIITYMRTDSLRISDSAAESAKEYITEKYGAEFYPKTRRVYKSRVGAQDAHEAVRPASMKYDPESIRKFLTNDQFKLYKLIWERFVASQMESAALDTVSIDIESAGYIFRSAGYTIKFLGFMALYEESIDEESNVEADEKEARLPEVNKDEPLQLSTLSPTQHFTQPPLHYTEASLIKVLEEKGIGRPSTYTPTITTIIQRGYVEREGKSLLPSVLGEITTSLMKDNFESIVDYSFTANMENALDEIENGKKQLTEVLHEFYDDFSKLLVLAETNIDQNSYSLPTVETDIICEKCGAKMVVKSGRFGKFAACPNYPECKNTKPLDKNGNVKTDSEDDQPQKAAPSDVKCDICGGEMVIRKGRYGSFYACAKYPECKSTKPITKDTNVLCPICGSKIVIKHGKNKTVFYSCEKYPECKFSSWDIPQNEQCPKCGSVLMRKKGKDLIYCYNETCDFKKTAESEPSQTIPEPVK